MPSTNIKTYILPMKKIEKEIFHCLWLLRASRDEVALIEFLSSYAERIIPEEFSYMYSKSQKFRELIALSGGRDDNLLDFL